MLFTSPEPKAQGTFSDPNLSVVHRRRCFCGRRPRYISFFSRITGPISTNFGTEVKGIQVCSNKRPRTFPRGDDNERVNIY